MAHFVDHVIDVISKSPELRTEQEVAEIIPWLRKRSSTLYQQTKAVLKNLVRNCHYRKSSADEVIIQQGELGDCMYIILRGKISVYIDPSMTGEDEGFSPVPPSPKKRGSGQESPMDLRKRRLYERSVFGKFIIQCESGKSFGELALLAEDSIRNATIVTDTNCDFMVVDRELFNMSLKEYEERSYAECRRFVHTHPFFSKMSPKFKRLLTHSVRKEIYGFESVLVKQGEPVIGLHFIRNGQAKMFMDPARHRHQYPHLWPFEAAIDIYSIEFDWLRDSRKNAILRKYRDPNVIQTKLDNVELRRKQGYAAVEKRLHEKAVVLCDVQNGEVLGDTEICLGLSTYMQTVVCSTETEVFILDMKNYERLVNRKNPNTTQMMKKHVESKLSMRKDIQYAQQIPLVKFLHHKLTAGALPESKKLPPLRASKVAPDIERERQYILENFREGKAPLVDPQVPGAVYYKNLMQEKARIRENIRKRGSPFMMPSKQKIKNPSRRQPRSRREIVESLRQMLEADLLMFQKPTRKKKVTSDSNETATADFVSEITGSRRTSFSEPGRSRTSSLSRKNKELAGSSGSLNSMSSELNGANNDELSSRTYIPLPPSESNNGKSNPRRRRLGGQNGPEKDQAVPSKVAPQQDGVVLAPIREDTAEQLLSKEKKESVDSKDRRDSTGSKDRKDSTGSKDRKESTGSKDRKESIESKDRKESIGSKDSIPEQAKEGHPLFGQDMKEVDTTAEPEAPPQSDQAGPEDPNLDPAEELLLPVLGHHPLTTGRSSVSSSKSKWAPALKFVQERIQDRFLTHLVDKDPSYADYDTSENTLSYLESRIRSFHIKYGNKNKMTLKLPKLRRFKEPTDNPETYPRPGGKVWIRKKLCQFANKDVQVKGHQHVRYHMVDSLPMFDDVRKTRMFMNFMLSAKNESEAASLSPRQQAITFTPDG